MKTPAPDGPADTRDMGIVHSALRRDLERARRALTEDPHPVRAKAIGAHLVWMMEFLHEHHSNEDQHYWPETLARNPDAAPVLERMEADHQGLIPLLGDLETAAARLADSGAGAQVDATLTALAAVGEPLRAHLEREEREAMPLVERSWTYAEHEEFSQLWIEGKSKPELAHRGMWLVDNADADARDKIFGMVPAPLAFVLRHTFGRRYDRLRQRLWGGTSALALAPITVDGVTA